MIQRRHVVAAALITGTLSPVIIEAQPSTPNLPILAKLPPESLVPSMISPDGRFVVATIDSTDLILYSLRDGRRVRVADGPVANDDVAWAPKGDRIAWARPEGGFNTIWTVAIDSATGAPRGAPQRVSVGNGRQPAIAFDGQFIAYSAPPATDANGRRGEGRRLTIVPVTGGPERTVATITAPFYTIFWSPDGKALYLGGGAMGDSTTIVGRSPVGLARIDIATGTIRVLEQEPRSIVGAASDRRFFVLATWGLNGNRDLLVVDSAGRRVGSINRPEGRSPFAMGLMGDTAIVYYGVNDRWALQVRDINGGANRTLPFIGHANFAPKYSPRGDKILIGVEDAGRRHLAIMNVDGTGARQFPDAKTVADDWGACWSPDGSRIAYQSSDRRVLALLDVASGRSRTLLTSAPQSYLGCTADWRYFTTYILGEGLVSVTQDGKRRVLVPHAETSPYVEYGSIPGGIFSRSGTTFTFYPADGSAPRRNDTAPKFDFGSPGVLSPDGRQYAVTGARRGSTEVEVLTLGTLQHRIFTVPFDVAWHQPQWSASQNALVVIGSRPTDDGRRVFRVPLAGGAPTVIGSINTWQPGYSVTLSPDGQRVMFPALRDKERTIAVFNIRPALRGLTTSRARE